MNAAVATASGGSWATVVMGGFASRYEDFWQLFSRLPGSARWRLVTPPGTDDNGGLVLSAGNGQTAVAAFRPSQLLTYTPLISTADGGRSWSALSPLDAALASAPAALAVQPGTGRMLVVTARGVVAQADAGSSKWQRVTSSRALASTPAGRRCGLTGLTAAAYGGSGILLGGSCSDTAAVGLFTETDGSWQAAGPALPATLGGQHVSVLRLAVSGSQVVALLQVGSGQRASVVAAWLGSRQRWAVSQPVRLGGAAVASTALGPGGAVAIATTAGGGDLVDKTGGSWQSLPRIPAGTATLAVGPDGGVQALAVSRSTLSVWQRAAGSQVWTRLQVLKVPIQYGSSG
jgi:hypothetical protein